MERQDYLQTEYAPSSRALCRGCDEKIAKELLRIGVVQDFSGFHSEKWYHPKCLNKIPKQIQNSELNSIKGIDSIKSNDRKIIKDLVENIISISSQKKIKNRKKSQKVYDIHGDDKQTQSDSKQTKQNQLENDSIDSESHDQKVIKQALVYNNEEELQFRDLKKDLQQKSMAKLQQMLQINEQTKTGTKNDLVERVADGMVK